MVQEGTLRRTLLSCCSAERCFLSPPLLFLPKLYKFTKSLFILTHTSLSRLPSKSCKHPLYSVSPQGQCPSKAPAATQAERPCQCSQSKVPSPTQAHAFTVPSCSRQQLSLRVTTQSFSGQRHQGQTKLALRKSMGYTITLKNKDILL